MSAISKTSRVLFLVAACSIPLAGGLSAQTIDAGGEVLTTVYGSPPSDLSELDTGPKIEGFIYARDGNRMQISASDGSRTAVTIGEATDIKATGGFLGLGRTALAADALYSGLPVTIETVRWGSGLVASEVRLKDKDLKTAAMIHNGTDLRFEQQIAATDALRGRLGDIDQYNIKSTTNVNFDTGKAQLSPRAMAELCATAAEAEQVDNALLLVVGYTDSTGSQELNQALSERRAGRVVNHLQQQCGWKPYRMLTPAGMSEADPLASNDTEYGKSQNRRVAVNVLVSKSVDGI
jgi:outer membrane protein OmpA-like peptidoglycan-associated protein